MKTKNNRLFFVDHLRTALAILVVLHHVALVYSASLPGYYYMEPPYNNLNAYKLLGLFIMVNQSWFMGAFFLLSGHFTPGSYDRKGAGKFILDKLVRLGIPAVFFSFVLNPIAMIGNFLMPSSLTGITTEFTWAQFWEASPKFIGTGPLWFVVMLLGFSLGYAVVRLIFKRDKSEPKTGAFPSVLAIAGFILGLAAVTYGFRIYFPIGKAVWQFTSFAYFPQYLSFFILGILAKRGDWFHRIQANKGILGLILAIVAAVVLFPLGFTGQLFSLEIPLVMENAFGYGHWQSGVYALWDSMFAVGIFMALVVLFRAVVNNDSKFGSFLTKHSYGVYFFHIPLVIFICYLIRNVPLDNLQKFGLASVIIVPVSFLVAFIVRSIPGMSKVL